MTQNGESWTKNRSYQSKGGVVEIPLKNPILEVKLTRNGDFGPKEGSENERGGLV